MGLTLLILLLAACVPVETPPQLTHTPGAPFVVTDETFDTGVFTVRYPTGWRVITGQASSPPSVIFASPDNTALIMVQIGAIESPPSPQTDLPLESITRTVEVKSAMITVYGTAPDADWDTFLPAFESVIASIAH